MDEKRYESYGVPRGIYSGLSYYGIAVKTGLFLVAVFVFSLQAGGVIFPKEQPFQYLAFIILFNILGIYLIIPSGSGVPNWKAIVYCHRNIKKKYISIERNNYPIVEGTPKHKIPGRRNIIND